MMRPMVDIEKLNQAYKKFSLLRTEYDAISKQEDTAWEEFIKVAERSRSTWEKSQAAWEEYINLVKGENGNDSQSKESHN